jgi:4-amino-4-deoxy-L-arabinose transferase-like glycosyltransferase
MMGLKSLGRMIGESAESRQRAMLWSIFVFLLVAAGFVLRLWGLSKMHYWDEAVYLQNAEVICCGKANYSELNSRPPLLSLFFAFLYIFWHHIYAACIGTALVNAAAPALLFAAGRRIVGRLAAAIAALLLAFSPFFVGVILPGWGSDNTGNSLLTDCPALTLILLSLWLVLYALTHQSAKFTTLRFALAGLAMAMAVLMRFASLSSVGMIGLLTLRAERRSKSAAACGLGFAAGIAPYLCWSRWSYGGFLTTFREGWVNFDGPEESFFFYLRNFSIIFGWITVAGLALWVGKTAWEWRQKARLDGSSKLAVAESGLKLQGFLCLWAVVVFFFFSLLSHKEPRYALPVAPPLLLLAGAGLSVLVKGRRRAVRAAGAMLLAGGMIYAFWPTTQLFQNPFLDNEVYDQITVSEYLTQTLPANAVLYSVVDYPVFAYYTNLKVDPVLGTGDELYETLDSLPEDGVFIAYKESGTAEGPRLSWLDANPHFKRLREFPSIVIYSYRVKD